MFRFFLVLSLAIAAATALQTTIYYEAESQESSDFFANQFTDAWATHGADLEVTFVPFGSAERYEDSEYFSCWNGPAQCFLNKVQLCTLSQLATAAEQADYVICANTVGEYPGEDCVVAAGVDWTWVSTCTEEGGDAASLMVDAYVATSATGQTEFPTIIFDGTFDQTLQDGALTDLSGTIADLLA